VTHSGLLLEIEEIVFDTRAIRATALQAALRDEGVTVALDAVLDSHAGSTAVMALDALKMLPLDQLGRELVLRRALDGVRQAFDAGLPSFDMSARDAIERLATERPIGVVSRATRDDATRMLQQAGLDMCVRTVQSLGDLALLDHHAVWSRAAATLLGAQAIAIVPPQIAVGPRAAGIRTVTVATNGIASGATLVSAARRDPSFSSALSAFSE
jgi:beta-phosphoglucomutase-like phosphatase (HAD superfamily)